MKKKSLTINKEKKRKNQEKYRSRYLTLQHEPLT